jgi:hypothetical protein
LDRVLEQVRTQLDLDAETEYELLDELRGHLEDAVAAARAQGLDEERALVEVAARFGVEEVGRELQAAHVGWGTADGVFAAGLPVLCALILRWLARPSAGGRYWCGRRSGSWHWRRCWCPCCGSPGGAMRWYRGPFSGRCL